MVIPLAGTIFELQDDWSFKVKRHSRNKRYAKASGCDDDGYWCRHSRGSVDSHLSAGTRLELEKIAVNNYDAEYRGSDYIVF